MDKIALAKLVSVFTNIARRELSVEEINEISTSLANSGLARVDQHAINALLLRMWRREKIEAIKEYRSITGLPLKDSKDAIEAYWLDAKPHEVA